MQPAARPGAPAGVARRQRAIALERMPSSRPRRAKGRRRGDRRRRGCGRRRLLGNATGPATQAQADGVRAGRRRPVQEGAADLGCTSTTRGHRPRAPRRATVGARRGLRAPPRGSPHTRPTSTTRSRTTRSTSSSTSRPTRRTTSCSAATRPRAPATSPARTRQTGRLHTEWEEAAYRVVRVARARRPGRAARVVGLGLRSLAGGRRADRAAPAAARSGCSVRAFAAEPDRRGRGRPVHLDRQDPRREVRRLRAPDERRPGGVQGVPGRRAEPPGRERRLPLHAARAAAAEPDRQAARPRRRRRLEPRRPGGEGRAGRGRARRSP